MVSALFAAVGDGTYKLFLFLHLLTVIVGVGAAFVLPVLTARIRRMDEQSRADAYAAYADSARLLVGPSLVVSGLFGVVLILLSDDAWSFSDGWISAAFALWIIGSALAIGLVAPAEMRLAKLHRQAVGGADVGAAVGEVRKRLAPAQGLMHLVLLALLVVMVWKPGA